MKKIAALLICILLISVISAGAAEWENSGGRWWYSYPDGGYARNEWLSAGAWYYFDGDGWMTVGWAKIGGNWYYFDSSGAMVTGWKNIGGTWYYFDGSGTMATGWKEIAGAWYFFAAGGDMQTGWLQQGENWYYLDESGVMVTGSHVIDGTEYLFDAGGIWQETARTGWVQKDNGYTYILDDGTAATGWQQIVGSWYYFDQDGLMQTGWVLDNGVWYYFAPDGEMKTGWVQDGGAWYLFAPSGAMETGWIQDGGVWYYFVPSGEMQTGWKNIDDVWYFFSSGGAMTTGWQTIEGNTYYFRKDGSMVTGTEIIDGKTYQFDENGKNIDVITITVFIGDPGDLPAEDNKIYKMMEEELGVTFKFEYLAGNLYETLGMKIANEDYPDLFCGGNGSDLIIDSGALINLLDYVSPEKTPRLWDHIEKQKARLIEKDEKGNDVLYIIPNYGLTDGNQIVNAVNGPAFFIQKQVLAWAGYPRIKTLNEYFDVLEQFIDANPTDENGNPYTGFDIMCEDWRHFCLLNPVQHLMGRPNDGEVIVCVTDQNYEVTGNDPSVPFKTETFIDKPYAKAYYKKLNEEFQKGLIDQSAFTDSYDTYIEKLSSGTVLGMFDQTWDFGVATQALTDAKMYENTYVALGLVYDPEDVNGVEIEEHYLNGNVPNIRRGFGISVNCECPERIAAMWEEMLSEKWQLIFNWGVENEDYYVEDGRLLMTEEQYANTYDSSWKLKNKADGIFTNSPKKQGWILEGELAGNCWEPGNQPEILFDLMNDYDKEFLKAYDYRKFSDFVNPPIELAPYGEGWAISYDPVEKEHTKFLEVQDQRLPELIMCDSAEFDTKWDAFVEEIGPFARTFENYMQQAILAEAEKVLGQ